LAKFGAPLLIWSAAGRHFGEEVTQFPTKRGVPVQFYARQSQPLLREDGNNAMQYTTNRPLKDNGKYTVAVMSMCKGNTAFRNTQGLSEQTRYF
jgi:hypothetical protein